MSAKALLIGGHPRSGTTLLCQLMNTHRDIQLTYELKSFMGINKRYRKSISFLRRDWYRRSALNSNGEVNIAFESWTILRFLIYLYLYRNKRVDLVTISRALNQTFPNHAVVGDKYPGYVFRLPRLIQETDLERVIIYRDCRDVAVSAMKMARSGWSDPKLVKHMSTARGVAARWLAAMDIMEQYQDHLHIVRYEDLLAEPGGVMGGLGDALGVDPAGFDVSSVYPDNSGQYLNVLSAAELADIRQTAGDMMHKYGYL